MQPFKEFDTGFNIGLKEKDTDGFCQAGHGYYHGYCPYEATNDEDEEGPASAYMGKGALNVTEAVHAAEATASYSQSGKNKANNHI